MLSLVFGSLIFVWVEIWNSERGLLPLGFGSAVWRFAISWCVATFGFDLWPSLWFVHNSYLVFVNLWFFSLYLVLRFVFVRESYLDIFGIWVCESASTPICIISNLFVLAHGYRLLP